MISLAPAAPGVQATVRLVAEAALALGWFGAAGGSSTFVTSTVTSIVSSIVAVVSGPPLASSPSVTCAVIVYESFVSWSSVVPAATLISPVVPTIVNVSLSPPIASDQVSVSPSASVATAVPTDASSALFSAIMNVVSSPAAKTGAVCAKAVNALPEKAATALPAVSTRGLLDGTT